MRWKKCVYDRVYYLCITRDPALEGYLRSSHGYVVPVIRRYSYSTIISRRHAYAMPRLSYVPKIRLFPRQKHKTHMDIISNHPKDATLEFRLYKGKKFTQCHLRPPGDR